MISKKIATISASVLISFNSIALQGVEGPRYDCNALETKQYIEQVSYQLFAPSQVVTPDEFEKAHTEKLQEQAASGDEGAQSCVSIFSDGRLKDDWKEAMEEFRNLDFDISFTSLDGAAIKAAMDSVKERVKAEMTEALNALGADICAMLDTDNLTSLANDALNEKYGVNTRSLAIKDYADSLTEQALLNADDDIQLLLSEDAIDTEIDNTTRDKIREVRKDLWRNF